MVIIIKIVDRFCTRTVIGAVMRSQFSTTAQPFQQHTTVRTSTKLLSKSISLRYCQSSPQTSTLEAISRTVDPDQRPLVVLLTWLAAQEKHIDKYRNLYLQRGFDVLTVQNTPFDLLFPSIGARKVAQNCVTTLEKELTQYSSVILHAFSVGAYQFGEILLKMQENQIKDAEEKNVKLENRIKGVVFDSCVAYEELSSGVSRSITPNPFLYKLIKSAINGHLKINYSIATKYYLAASEAAWSNYLKVPALILASKNDRIGTAAANQRLANVWSNLGIDITWKCWEKSEHVQHLPRHTKEYEDTVDSFLNKININTNVINF